MTPDYQDKGINFYCCDCIELLKEKPDNYWDLAICDVPYGLKKDGQKACNCKNPKHNRKEHIQKDWDNEIPSKEYFNELFRVSKNQIMWGANYFPQYLTGSMGWIFWDKGQELNQSDGELAYSSFNKALRRIIINRVELLKDGTIHPTQKPLKLYRWLLKNYAKPGDRILDTHGGSGSSAIACALDGFEMDIAEIDEDYFKSAIKRFKESTCQMKLFP